MNPYNLYSHLPLVLQNAAFALKSYQLDCQRYRGGYEKTFDFLLHSEQASAEEVLRYKEAHIAEILDYAYQHCPYYRSRFKRAGLTPADFKQLDDLRKFPTLTKEDVRMYWAGMLSDEAQSMKLIPYHTSGSTGKALDFWWTQRSLQFYWATVWRGRRRVGIERGDLHLNFTGKIVVPLGQQRPPYWRFNKPLNQYMLNMQHITDGKVGDIVAFINSKPFRFFVGYPSIIYSLAILAEEHGLEIVSPPEYIFPSAEKLYDFQREKIEKVFSGTQIMAHYGFSENAGSASQCRCGCYHEDYELGHLELHDPVPAPTGMCGKLLATGFQNFGMPFIRYEVGDTATFSNLPCNCGLHSPVIADIEGRNGDYVVTPEGAHIMRFGYILKETVSIKECQVVQRELGAVVFRIVRRADYDMRTEKQVRDAVASMISPNLRVEFEYVDAIPRTRTGKFRAVISELR